MRYLSAVLLLAACTSHNPNYLADGSAPSLDLAPDLSGGLGACTAGGRACAGTTASEHCDKGQLVVDRLCPSGSTCQETYCAPPAPMLPTQIGQRCDVGGPQELQCSANRALPLACQPFVNRSNLSLQWFCDRPVGAGGAGTSCTRGHECQSGVCGANGTCFRACQMDFECTNGLKCNMVQIVVEGVRVQTGSCSP